MTSSPPTSCPPMRPYAGWMMNYPPGPHWYTSLAKFLPEGASAVATVSPSVSHRPMKTSRRSSAVGREVAVDMGLLPSVSGSTLCCFPPAPVVHGDRAAAERLRRDQLEPSRAGQPALVQGRAVAGDPGGDEELVLVDKIHPVQLGGALSATEEHAGRGRVLELLHARAQVAGDVVAVGPREVLSRRRHHVLRLGLQLDRPLPHPRRRLLVPGGDRRPVTLHHLVGDAAPQHRPALVHEAGEEGVCLVVGDSLLVVDAAVESDVDAEGQESHAASLSHTIARGNAS